MPSLVWQVALEGTSREQQLFIEEHVGAISGEGGRPVLVLDGSPYPPKADEVASRRAKRDEAEQTAHRLERNGEGKAAAAAWKRAARPQEPFYSWLLQWCRAKRVAYIVAPYEADEMLVALQEHLGEKNTIVLAASQCLEFEIVFTLLRPYSLNHPTAIFRAPPGS